MAVAEAKPQYSHAEKKRFRISFGKQKDKMAIPNLLEIQLKSYRDFLQADSKLNEHFNELKRIRLFQRNLITLI